MGGAVNPAHEELQDALVELTDESKNESLARAKLDRALAELTAAMLRHVKARARVAQAERAVELEEKEAAS
jgi:hypothetical protein